MLELVVDELGPVFLRKEALIALKVVVKLPVGLLLLQSLLPLLFFKRFPFELGPLLW